jgi:hypothetical protein
MSGAIPPLPQYAFMAWCSVKAQGQLYFTFTFTFTFTIFLPLLVIIIIFLHREIWCSGNAMFLFSGGMGFESRMVYQIF